MMRSTPSIRLPAGVRDFLPRATARRRGIAEALVATFESWGYSRIITPAFEYADVLERGLGEDARAAAIRFVEPASGEVVALRPDITPQVARLAATRLGDVGGPLRLCYEGAVTRLAPGGRGQREVLQAGVELIGVAGADGDAEVIAVAAAALATARVRDVHLELGHVALARVALDAIRDPAARAEVKALLAKKDRAAVAAAARRLGGGAAALLAALPMLSGPPAEVLARARALRLPPAARVALAAVEEVLAAVDALGARELAGSVSLDLGEVRGFDYYTGLRFAGFAAGAGDAVLRGGRYDELVGRYGRSAPATGFAVDIEAIAQAERAAGVAPPAPAMAVLVAGHDRPAAARVAAALRARGCVAALHLGDGIGQAMAVYAAASGFTHVVVVGVGTGRVAGRVTRLGDGRIARLPAGAIARAARGDAAPLGAALERRTGWQSSS